MLALIFLMLAISLRALRLNIWALTLKQRALA